DRAGVGQEQRLAVGGDGGVPRQVVLAGLEHPGAGARGRVDATEAPDVDVDEAVEPAGHAADGPTAQLRHRAVALRDDLRLLAAHEDGAELAGGDVETAHVAPTEHVEA